jgi:hypothetical protein
VKWAATIIVVLLFLYGIERGWHSPHPDVIYYPFSGFITGLFFFWLLRAALRAIHKQSDDDGVGATLFWISSGVALYYFVLVGFAIYLRYQAGVIGPLVVTGSVCWGIGWAIRRSFAAKQRELR